MLSQNVLMCGESIGNIIQYVRVQKGISMKELRDMASEKLNGELIDISTIAKLENGDLGISMGVLFSVIDALNLGDGILKSFKDGIMREEARQAVAKELYEQFINQN